MPVFYSKPEGSSFPNKVPWISEFIYLTETGLLTPTTESFGFKAYISSHDPLSKLNAIDYLKYFRAESPDLLALIKITNDLLNSNAEKMSDNTPAISPPAVKVTSPGETTSRPAFPTRKSSSFHKNLITKLRPLPFQYVWAVWHDKASNSSSATEGTNTTTETNEKFEQRLTLLADSVPDIATFYRIYNNLPWESIRMKDSIHIFRSGVKPLWEDPENLEGGSWTMKVRREEGRAVRVWEEVCLLTCGGELQAALSPERDHVLGVSYSPRLYWAHISVWTKKGSNKRSVELLEQTLLEGLSPELKPKNEGEFYYKRHQDHEGWASAVAGTKED